MRPSRQCVIKLMHAVAVVNHGDNEAVDQDDGVRGRNDFADGFNPMQLIEMALNELT